ncbi:2-dehydropantoate 2-reductase [Labedaea rhizosphaerae]|uniref:2-dehydropantoate 2-reductase n=1 Tax=Labedaea rhizosphaerae TaxID=598644 RepID=A0A4R6RSY9_LABRH|nr:2-dehydropantoate 2-reductase [Labedaea rhizosphaerae]TDP89932.1 ketopantoate reductase [Labedaea rhizosphaerae]
MTIAVVGAGAVGGYFGGVLAAAGNDVRFLTRGSWPGGVRVNDRPVQVQATDDPRALGEVEVVLLCVKTPQLPAAVDALGPVIGTRTVVITVQNGVEAPEEVAQRIGRDHVLPGLARIVATTTGPGEIRQVGPPGALGFAEWDGSVSKRVLRLREVLSAVPMLEPPDIWAALWAKFLLVVPVGSLGAATGGATIGELRSREGIRKLLIAGMREIYATGLELGIALPVDAVENAVALMDRQGADVTSSLQRDLLAGRPSELEAWTGAAVRLAHKAGMSAPVHELLYELLATRASLAIA